ncbi:MAG: energy transducer TonB [Bacteroidia bacterium]
MKTNLFSSNHGLDEVVFENRNKMYGAYDLRKTHEERLTLSAMATVSFFMLLLSSFFIFQTKPEMPDITAKPDDGGLIILTDPRVIIPEPERMFQPPAASANVTPEIVKHKVENADQPKPVKDIPLNTGGDGTGNGVPGGTGNLPSTGTGTTIPVTLPIPKPEPAEFIEYYDKAPQFPNYESYLQNHINYPDYAISNNIQGTIFVMVKINETGKVVGAEIIKGIGGGCDQEALRVIKSMPDWLPGLQNGKPVPVKCVLRVKMLLQN